MREVEFARCLRLRQTSLEPVTFRLPRVRVRLGARHANAQHPLPSSCQRLWGLTGLVTKLPHSLLFGAPVPLTLLVF